MIGQSNIYRTLFEKINDGILILSPEGKILECNDAASNILGYSPEELTEIHFETAFVEPSHYHEIINLIEDETPIVDYEIALLTKEQFKINCALTTCIETDLSQKVTGYLVVLKNITRRIQTEKALNERLRFETGVATAFRSLYQDTRSAVNEALHHILSATDVGRVTVLRAQENVADKTTYLITHEVEASDIQGSSNYKENEGKFPTAFFEEDGSKTARKELINGNEVVVHLSKLQGQARGYFEAAEIKSTLILPFQVNKNWFGMLLLSDHEIERDWDELTIELMQTFSSMLGTYFSRKQAQDRLDEQQYFLRQVIDLNPEFVFVKDKTGRYELVNQAFADRYNMSVDDIVGQTDEILTNDIEKVKMFHQADMAILDAGESHTVHEDQVVFMDGATRWLKTTKRPIFDANGQPSHLLGLSVDMTDQVEALRNLSDRERFLRTVLDALPGAIWWKDTESVFLGSNQFLAELLGTTVTDIIGKTDYDLPFKKEEADAYRADDAEVMKTGTHKIGIIEPQLRLDGTTAWLETNKIALKDEDGNVYGVLGTFQDITERIDLQNEVRTSLERRSRQVELTTHVAQEVANATDLNQLYDKVVSQVKEQFGYYHVQLLKYDPALDTVALIAGYGEAGQKMIEMNHAMPMGVGLIGTAAATGQSVLRPHIARDPNWRANPLLPDTKGEIAVPIVTKSTVLGVLDVQSNMAGALTEDDQILLEGLCGQIAIAIESTNLRQELESQLRELMQLQQRLSGEAWREYNETVDQKGYNGFEYDLSSLRPLQETDPTSSEFENIQEESLNLLSYPVSLRGQTIGYMGIKETNNAPLADEEEVFLEAISNEVAGALEAARLFEEIESSLVDQARIANELETVAQVSTAAATVLDSEYLLQSVVDLAKESFQLYHAHVYLVNERGDFLELIAGSGAAGQLMALEGHRIMVVEDSIVARAARNRDGVLVNDVRRTVDFLPNPMLPETKAEIAVPMIVGDRVIGVLDLQASREGAFSENDLRIFTILASQIAVAHENAKQYALQVETAQKLREVDLLKSEFLASMSHELRTPLNSIIGFADVLLEGLDGELNERMEEDVRLIRQSGAHLRELIGDILDMSKIEAGKMELRYEDINIIQMAQDIMKTAHPLAQEKSLELLLDLDDSIEEIKADRTRLRQVLWNIMGNAIKFTEKGSVTLRIAAKDDHALVSVKDTGIGISESHIPIVFEQFRQVDGSMERVIGGTGLGMPISKRLVELHGGQIWVESVVDQGSTFFFTIPYEPSMKSD